MTLESCILAILHKQKEDKKIYPADIVLSNGNLLVRMVILLDYDPERGTVKGITCRENYSAFRENREQEYLSLSVSGIASIENAELGVSAKAS